MLTYASSALWFWSGLVCICGVPVCLGCGSYGCLQRQFHRLVEMLILRNMDITDERAQRAYRLQVKERLYRFNYVSAQLRSGTVGC